MNYFSEAQKLCASLNDNPQSPLSEQPICALSNNITTSTQLTEVLNNLDEAQCVSVLNAVETHLPKIISNGRKLGMVLDSLDEAKFTLVLNALADHLPTIISESKELGIALLYLDEAKGSSVISALKGHLPTIISDGTQLRNVLCYLNKAKSTSLISALADHVPQIISDATQLAAVLRISSEAGYTHVLSCIAAHVPVIITNHEQLTTALHPLNNLRRISVISALTEDLPKLIIHHEQLAATIQPLNSAQRNSVLYALTNTSTGLDFLQSIPPKKLAAICGDDALNILHLKKMLNQIHAKSEALRQAGAENKANAAQNLYQKMTSIVDVYLKSPQQPADYTAFKSDSELAINEAKESNLTEHRGWKSILTNLFIGVVTLGIAFIANNIMTEGKHSFFKLNTDSLNKVDELNKALRSMSDTPPRWV